jgi:hypothetical protein
VNRKNRKRNCSPALKNTNQKDRILAILPEIGEPVALETVSAYFKNSTGKTKETAFEALTNWKEYAASTALYEICQTSTGDFRAKAFASFIRQVRTASLPDDQKLLQFRKIIRSQPLPKKKYWSSIPSAT